MSGNETLVSPATTLVSPVIQQSIEILIAIIGSGITLFKVVRYIQKIKQRLDDLEKRYNENPIIKAYEKIKVTQDDEIEKKFIEQSADIIGMFADKKDKEAKEEK